MVGINRRFEWVIRGEVRGEDQICDLDLGLNKDIAVVPTLGSLVPGWLLLVPRASAVSIADSEEEVRQSMNALAKSLQPSLRYFAPEVTYFEHGPAAIGSQIGCGVDQAHVHAVPLDFDLLEVTSGWSEQHSWLSIDPDDPWPGIESGKSYYLIYREDRALVCYPEFETSQFFRRVIANKLGCPESWDYRKYPWYRNAQQTVDWFKQEWGAGRAA